MARTLRDIAVYGRSEHEVWDAITAWTTAHSGRVVQSSAQPGGAFVKVRVGAALGPVAVWKALRFFDITLRPIQDGVLVHMEGYTKTYGMEEDFSPNAIMGALPRREGWRILEDLSNRLAYLSGPRPSRAREEPHGAEAPREDVTPPGSTAAPSPYVPAAAGPSSPQASLAAFCIRCGAPFEGDDKFCGRCGSPRA